MSFLCRCDEKDQCFSNTASVMAKLRISRFPVYETFIESLKFDQLVCFFLEIFRLSDCTEESLINAFSRSTHSVVCAAFLKVVCLLDDAQHCKVFLSQHLKAMFEDETVRREKLVDFLEEFYTHAGTIASPECMQFVYDLQIVIPSLEMEALMDKACKWRTFPVLIDISKVDDVRAAKLMGDVIADFAFNFEDYSAALSEIDALF